LIIEFQTKELVQEPRVLKIKVKKALEEIRTNKATGSNSIQKEWIKADGEEGINILSHQKVWESGVWPGDWKKSI